MAHNQAPPLREFRTRVRNWLEEKWPQIEPLTHARRGTAAYVDAQKCWMALRHEAGLATPHWPVRHGGSGLGLEHQIVAADEMARAGAPDSDLFIVSLNHFPATLLACGTEEQQQKFLPTVQQGAVWCQGFSEPNAGSDLASLTTRADLDGDEFVINGHKIWSSFSMYADYCILLARTSSGDKKHEGITFFLMDMKSAGIRVSPIRKSTGISEFGEMFLEGVRIPAANVVGQVGHGWAVCQVTLAAERGLLVFEELERQWYDTLSFFKSATTLGATWLEDDASRREFIELMAEVQANRLLVRKLLRSDGLNGTAQSLTAAFVKVLFSTSKQKLSDLITRIECLGGQVEEGASRDGRGSPMHDYLASFGHTIAGGSNEIMRNIIAERGLGMPR